MTAAGTTAAAAAACSGHSTRGSWPSALANLSIPMTPAGRRLGTTSWKATCWPWRMATGCP